MVKYSDPDITLRPLEITDADAAVVWYLDEKVAKFCSWDAFTSRESALDYFVKHDLPRSWNKAICAAGRAVGSISVNPFHGNDRCRAELGYVVASEYWGRGIATRAVTLAANAVFLEWSHLERLEAVVDLENTASQRVLEKAGFVRDGLFRKYYLLDGKPRDALIYSLLSTDAHVSRSIGDVYLKKPEFHRDPIFQQYGNYVPMKRPLMTAEPSIVTRKLRPQDMFLIFASDGLWEQLSDDAAVQIVSKHPRAGIAKRLVAAAIQEAAKKREMRYNDIKKIEKGIRRHFHDDITVIVIYLDQQTTFSIPKHNKQGAAGYTTPPVDIYSHNSDEVMESSGDKIFPNEESRANVLF